MGIPGSRGPFYCVHPSGEEAGRKPPALWAPSSPPRGATGMGRAGQGRPLLARGPHTAPALSPVSERNGPCKETHDLTGLRGEGQSSSWSRMGLMGRNGPDDLPERRGSLAPGRRASRGAFWGQVRLLCSVRGTPLRLAQKPAFLGVKTEFRVSGCCRCQRSVRRAPCHRGWFSKMASAEALIFPGRLSVSSRGPGDDPS